MKPKQHDIPRISDLGAEQKEPLAQFLTLIFGEENRALAQGYIGSMFSDDFRKAHFRTMRDEKGGVIGAFCVTEELFTVGTWGISWVAVHPDYRGRGFGKALILDAVETVRRFKNGRATVILSAYKDKASFYQELGFSAMGDDHEGNPYMRLILNS